MNLQSKARRIRLPYATRYGLLLHWLWFTAMVSYAGPPAPPVILFQPVEQRAVSGGRTELGVTAQAAPGDNGTLSFQWVHDGKPVPGAESRVLVFSPVKSQDAGAWQVVVRGTAGETWSRTTTLHVTEDPPAPGTSDSLFAAAKIENPGGTRGTVFAIAPAADGGMLIGGDFTTVGGVSRPGLAKLTAGGALDSKFVLSGLPPSLLVVRCLAAVPGGWLAGGKGFATRSPWLAFIPANGESVVNMDSSWSFEVTADQEVRTLLPLPDGRVLAGGTFTAKTAGYTTTRLLRLNTNRTLDTTLPVTVWNSGVLALARTPAGNILVSGAFSLPKRCIARLLEDGGHDDTFAMPTAGWSGVSEVSALAVQNSGRIIAGGKFSFTAVGSFNRSAIMAFKADGTPDFDFAAKPNTDQKAEIRALLVDNHDEVLVGGKFTEITDTNAQGGEVKLPWAGVVRLNSAGRLVQPQRAAAWDDRTVFSLAMLSPPGKPRRVLAGGDFAFPANRLTALRADAPSLTAPVILSAPVPRSRILRAGDPLRISVAATAWPEPLYQWFRNGEPVPGAVSAELYIPNAQIIHHGNYSVVITNDPGNPARTVTSAPVKITILAAPPGFAPLATGVSAAPLTIAERTKGRSAIHVDAPFAVTRIAVALRISHKDTNDLSATLYAPGGFNVKVFDFASSDPTGRDFDQTVFDETSTLHLEDSLPPFRGTFQSKGDFNNLRAGPATGDWFLEIDASDSGQTAVLESWQLMIEGAPAPVTYESWRATAISGQANSAPNQDADGDGVSNVAEWLFGPAPCGTGNSSAGISELTLDGDGFCQFHWEGWQSVAYQLEWSTDLVQWQRAEEGKDYTTIYSSSTEPSRTERSVRLAIPLTSAFWRLRGG